ncbi:NUDIX domain-containing protein [Phaeobacter sp. B1627]|uniref:NUDIX domain-containing protein n=1 Tax=Phaeobacter sp. B1627 TaxID=2583809 RepID=UPI00111839FC|nr:NUDIX domain-containing protein [Phaeobacter sp. B1627]TNJ41483.1 NUDIX domain-containing protein [Phaeobacter sp. B1627]
MTDVFFGGALCLPDVLNAVLGHGLLPEQRMPAVLADHALVICDPAHHPTIVPSDGSEVHGLCLSGLSEAEQNAICYYETCFGRRAVAATVETGTGRREVKTAVGTEPSRIAHADLADWSAEWTGVATRMASELMAYQTRKPAQDMTKSLFSMRLRASAWLSAQRRHADPARDLSRDVTIQAHKREYVNFFAMEEMDLQYRKFDGSMSQVINRGVVLGGEAAVVLPYDIRRDAVLLIEQFRAAVFIAGEINPWLWEPPAGLLDPGESPEAAARREAKEEAGLELTHLEPVSSLYPSSGMSGEYVHIFCGLADFSSIEGGGGVPSEGEDIRSKVISFQELMAGVDNRTYQDMPLVTSALWLARHRDRLRAEFA